MLTIGHFGVAFFLCVNTSLPEKPFIRKCSFSCISVYVEIFLANETTATRCKGTRYQPSADIKQLLDEVEHDIVNYQNRGLCYLPKPKAEAYNSDTRF